jgi:hypothetical protein
MRNLGSLSNAEGEKVATELGNLDPNMSPDAFKAQLGVVRKQIASLRAAMKKDLEQQTLAGQGGPQSTARTTRKGVSWGY